LQLSRLSFETRLWRSQRTRTSGCLRAPAIAHSTIAAVCLRRISSGGRLGKRSGGTGCQPAAQSGYLCRGIELEGGEERFALGQPPVVASAPCPPGWAPTQSRQPAVPRRLLVGCRGRASSMLSAAQRPGPGARASFKRAWGRIDAPERLLRRSSPSGTGSANFSRSGETSQGNDLVASRGASVCAGFEAKFDLTGPGAEKEAFDVQRADPESRPSRLHDR
jgi:hypothetical protein